MKISFRRSGAGDDPGAGTPSSLSNSGVAALFHPDALIEVEVVVAVPRTD